MRGPPTSLPARLLTGPCLGLTHQSTPLASARAALLVAPLNSLSGSPEPPAEGHTPTLTFKAPPVSVLTPLVQAAISLVCRELLPPTPVVASPG